MKQWYICLTLIVLGFLMTVCMGIQYADMAKRCHAAEAVIDQVWEEQPDYYLDVLVEGDVYQEWAELAE